MVKSIDIAGVNAAVGDSCSIGFEPGIGIWSLSLKGGTVGVQAGIIFNGTANDVVQLNPTSGVVAYMSAGDADFATGTKGKMEINFPATTGGTVMEITYGKGGKFITCSSN